MQALSMVPLLMVPLLARRGPPRFSRDSVAHTHKTRLHHTIDGDVFKKHRTGPHPAAAVTRQRLVQHQWLQCFTVAHNAQQLVLAAFVVEVAAQGWAGQRFKFIHDRAG